MAKRKIESNRIVFACVPPGRSGRNAFRAHRAEATTWKSRALQRDKIKPILFSIIKHTDSEELKRQLPKDVVSGVMVAVVALPLSIALAIASGVS